MPVLRVSDELPQRQRGFAVFDLLVNTLSGGQNSPLLPSKLRPFTVVMWGSPMVCRGAADKPTADGP